MSLGEMLQYFHIIELTLKALDSMTVIVHVADSCTLLLVSLEEYILDCKIILEPITSHYVEQILLKSCQNNGCS